MEAISNAGSTLAWSSSTPPASTPSATCSPTRSLEPIAVEQLVQSLCDTKHGYTQWKAAAIEANSQASQSMLKKNYRGGISREDAVVLALKVLNKIMDSTRLTLEKLELAKVFLQPGTGEVQYQSAMDTTIS
ncbi:hypothetical protein QYE76_007379 [Lolium multiflorum]|uniref:Uncharacterized protein n=1 Tax=Lolium multiflorum TaxID=4521 RepID=A0AAD8W487_LOLMU|nr:hypothetical protein QYE76_007379 [Lolium multiflorum]